MSPSPIELSTDLEDLAGVPYFLWDEPLTLAELSERLAAGSQPERMRLLGKILREARDTDVWRFTTPRDVAARWTELEPHLGRRRDFWRFILDRWRAEGLLEPR